MLDIISIIKYKYVIILQKIHSSEKFNFNPCMKTIFCTNKNESEINL